MVAQKSVVNYPNYHGLILGDGLFISLSTRVALDLQTIYIYIHISPYISICTQNIYIYIYYTYTHISTYDIYTIILFCFRPNPPGGSFDGTSVARCHGRSHKCAAPFRAVVREMLGLFEKNTLVDWVLGIVLPGLFCVITYPIVGETINPVYWDEIGVLGLLGPA